MPLGERERENWNIKNKKIKKDKTLKRYLLLLLLLLKITLDEKKNGGEVRERERGPIRPSLRSVVIGVCVYL